MKKMYKQPQIEVTRVASMKLMDGSAVIVTDPQQDGGIGGNAPKRGDIIE